MTEEKQDDKNDLKIPIGYTGMSSEVNWFPRYRMFGVAGAWDVIRPYFERITEEGKRDSANFGYTKVQRHHVCGIRITERGRDGDGIIECKLGHDGHSLSVGSGYGYDVDGMLRWYELSYYEYDEPLYDIPQSYRNARKKRWGDIA